MEGKTRSNSYGLCRCCLSKGNHRNISKEYVFEGGREVYIEIFMDCFNLFLSTEPTVSPLICAKCVARLREANDFRTMVANAEKQLLNDARNKLDTVFVNVPIADSVNTIVKPEPEIVVKQEELSDHFEDDHHISAEDLFDDSKPEDPDAIPGEVELISRFNPQELKPLVTRQNLYQTCPQYVMHLDLLKNVVITSQMIKLKLKAPTHDKRLFVSEKLAHITNVSTLLQYSNLTPFKSKSRSGFPCFYCRNTFEEFAKLREHVLVHKSPELYRVLKQSGTESLVVYAEVTNLICNICNASISNINELKSHLNKLHSKKIYNEVSDRVIPFKVNVNKYECQICGCNFETFGAVERHMNGHYRNYVCKDCGSGFVTKYRLKVHAKSMHVDGSYPCEFCGKVFSTQQKHKNHVNAVHKLMKRFKCIKCPQRFTEYFRRQKHMENAHGMAPLKYKCNVCDRCFDRRYTLSRHLKRDHLEERDFQCEICAYKCFTKNELKVHMIKHNGERIFECSVCKKSYARKKTLKEHMRIHSNDRRFSCAVCGQAFVQKCSLKGHLKTHHLEYTVQ